MSSFRELLSRGQMVEMLLVHDALSATIAEYLGFDTVIVGAAMTAQHGHMLQDGMLSPSEVIDQVRRVRAASDLVITADIDDAGGVPPQVHRHFRAAEDAGASAILIEDIDCASRFRWSDDLGSWEFSFSQQLKPVGAAAYNIGVAAAARRRSDTVIIARTEAMVATDLDDALVRMRAYVDNGAEVIYAPGLPVDLIEKVNEEFEVPVMHPVTAIPSPEQHADLIDAGVGIACYTVLYRGNGYGSLKVELAGFGPLFSAAPSPEWSDELPETLEGWLDIREADTENIVWLDRHPGVVRLGNSNAAGETEMDK